MSKNLTRVLSSLRDVDGIVGSFVVNADGELVAQDLPAYFEGVAEQVAPRAVRLRDALSLSEGSVSTCTIRYADHKLSLRSVHGALLAVLANHHVNAPALRMAMNLVVRKCSPEELASAAFTHQPPAAVEVAPAPAEIPPVVAEVAPVAPRPPAGMPPPPSARLGATLPSVVPPSLPERERIRDPNREGGATPDSEPASARKERAVYFRGKRVN